MTHSQIAVIKGDGIGIDVTNAALAVVEAARDVMGGFSLEYREILAGASYFNDKSIDIEPGGEQAAGDCDAIFLGAIGLPAIRHEDGTEISPHLRLRDIYGLYAGVRPVKAYPNAPKSVITPACFSQRTAARQKEASAPIAFAQENLVVIWVRAQLPMRSSLKFA